MDGVGEVATFGAGDYSMRIWLDPRKLKQRGLTTTDIVDASVNRTFKSPPVRSVPRPLPRKLHFNSR